MSEPPQPDSEPNREPDAGDEAAPENQGPPPQEQQPRWSDAGHRPPPYQAPSGSPFQSAQQAPGFGGDQHQHYAAAYQSYYAQYQPHAPQQQPAAPAAGRGKGWMWPLVVVLALVAGAIGGGIAGSIVGGQQDKVLTGGGVLKVQRRTEAPLPPSNRSIAAVARKVLPGSVQIVAEYKGDPQGATGSGWVFDREGHVITNNHVVAEAASDSGPIDVIDHRGKHHKATVIGRSPVYDIAVLKVQGARQLSPLAIGSSDQMRVGETVVAIGSPLGLSATVTSGIISAKDRPVTTGDGNDSSYINALQTDAAINPGNSGGPLVDLNGRVIGVNSAIASLGASGVGGESGNIGVGFAIPIEQVEVTTDQILRTGHAEYPVIGASVRGRPQLDGATIERLTPGDPAQKAGLKVGDRIVAVNGQPVTGSIDLVVDIRTHVPGDTITLTVKRHGHQRKVKVKLAAKIDHP